MALFSFLFFINSYFFLFCWSSLLRIYFRIICFQLLSFFLFVFWFFYFLDSYCFLFFLFFFDCFSWIILLSFFKFFHFYIFCWISFLIFLFWLFFARTSFNLLLFNNLFFDNLLLIEIIHIFSLCHNWPFFNNMRNFILKSYFIVFFNIFCEFSFSFWRFSCMLLGNFIHIIIVKNRIFFNDLKWLFFNNFLNSW